MLDQKNSAAHECAPPAEQGESDFRRRPRRRGRVLHEAIYQAALDELSEVGYAELTMDRVAARAKASKGSLYRRWPSRVELVVDAIRYAVPQFSPTADIGDLRAELVAQFRQFAEHINGPAGEASRGMIVELMRNPELREAFQKHLIDPVLAPMMEVLRRGVVRGEVRPGALTPTIARVGPTLMRQHVLLYGPPIEDEVLLEIIDEVVLPLVRLEPSPAGE
jgi:AcrR family transcriptional regulator